MNRPEGCPTVTVLICTLNEEEGIGDILERIPLWVDEILLVDGNSADNTVEIARSIRPRTRVLYQPGKGKGDALRCGIENATGEVVVTLDADRATDPEDMPRFIEPLLNGYDFAKGSRFLQRLPHNKPWHRVMGNWAITITFDVLFLRGYTDLCSGYNAFWRKSVGDIKWPQDGFENEPFINCQVAKRKLKVIEVVHLDQGRLKGEVKESSWRQGFKAIKTILRERFRG